MPPTVPTGHDVLLDVIGTKIVSGAWPVGSVLTVADLEVEFSASRTAVREVIRVLEGLTMVSSKRRVGLTIQDRSQWRMLDPRVIAWRIANDRERKSVFREIGDLRRGIEPEVARLAARNASRRQSEELLDLAEEMERLGLSGRGAEPEFLRLDMQFHLHVMRACGNDLFASLTGIVETLLVERSRWNLQPPHPDVDAMRAHVAVAQAILDRDEAAAHRASTFIVNQADDQIQERVDDPR